MTTIVIVCDHGHSSGGLAKVAITAAVGLARRGHRVVYVSAIGPVAEELGTDGITAVCLHQTDLQGARNLAEAAIRGLWNRQARRRLADILERCPRHDTIVHIHGWAKALSPSVVWAARRSGLPVLFTLHDYFALCPNGAFFNFQKGRNCGLTALSPACVATHCDARAYDHKLWRVARHMVGTATRSLVGGMTLISLSERQRAVIARHLPPGTRTVHVPNPVDVEDRGPAAVGDNRHFLFVGRLSSEKGPTLLAEAAAKAGVPVRFVGDGQEAGAVRRVLPEADMPGWLPTARVMEAIRGARALVLPSLWYETFGLAVYEALANGVPVIVSDNTAAAEAVQHGRNGLLFRSGDRDDLAAQLLALSDGDEARRMGQAAYQLYWRAPFTLDRHLDRLEQVCANAMRAAAASAAVPSGAEEQCPP